MHEMRLLEMHLETLDFNLVNVVKGASKAATNGVTKAGRVVVNGLNDARTAYERWNQIKAKEESIKKKLQLIIDDFSTTTSNLHTFEQTWRTIWEEILALDTIKHPPPVPQ